MGHFRQQRHDYRLVSWSGTLLVLIVAGGGCGVSSTPSTTVEVPPTEADVAAPPAPQATEVDEGLHLRILDGKVIAVADGDTITVLDAMRQSHKVRLEGIDAPERKQGYGTRSKEALAEKVFRQQVQVRWSGRDRYDRILGHVYLGEHWINHELVAEGWAWHYKRYSSDPELAAAEAA